MPTFFGIGRVVPRHATRAVADIAGVCAGIPAATRAHCSARACLAALQGGQAGATPIKDMPQQQALIG